jgi:hypothetical protein
MKNGIWVMCRVKYSARRVGRDEKICELHIASSPKSFPQNFLGSGSPPTLGREIIAFVLAKQSLARYYAASGMED